jgi:hypothetical protein
MDYNRGLNDGFDRYIKILTLSEWADLTDLGNVDFNTKMKRSELEADLDGHNLEGLIHE